MTDLTKEKAWVIFRADKLGHEEASGAFDTMTREDFDAYECYADEFDLEIAKIGVEAQNEAAEIMEVNPNSVAYLESIKRHNWTANEYKDFVELFEDSKFETLHLSAMFGVPNNELLLELVKP